MRYVGLKALMVAAALPLMVASCGGGYGSGGGGGGGGGTCGGAYVSCPPPTVALTAPASGATVHGTVALTATATASATYSLTIKRVDFMIDGTNVGMATTSPYTVNWNSASVGNGSHTVTAKATDSANGTATSSGTVVTVSNAAAMALALEPAQIVPAVRSSASGMAHLIVELETGATRGRVLVSGMSATAVTINAGFAGATGERLIALAPGAAAGEWTVPAGALLTADQLTALLQGRLYMVALSATHPRGEIRGQITPRNILVAFTELSASPEAETLGIAASGIAATTLDLSAHTLTIQVNSRGVEGAISAQALTGGLRPASLERDSVDMSHWSTELAPLSAAELARFQSGGWSVMVATEAVPGGAISGQIAASH
jgi:hypothetical protein